MKMLFCGALPLMTVLCCSGGGGRNDPGASGAGGSASTGTGGRGSAGGPTASGGDSDSAGVGGVGEEGGVSGMGDGGASAGLGGDVDEGRGPGSQGGRGGSGPQSVQVSESEPNNGPTLTGLQDLGTFDVSKTIVLKGKLSTGGNDGAMYTGDFDGFVFTVAAAGGTLTLNADWTGSADVDLVFYDANLSPVFEDGTTAKPIQSTGPAPAGKFAFVLFSKDLPADWTVTLTYTKPVPTSDASCTSPL
ncbi:MAG TPA: hypothetical protein VJV79_09035, partial [Polyangiaceae bacterium]|nr:hypothetical protein [Polyangiaceae bacterium]